MKPIKHRSNYLCAFSRMLQRRMCSPDFDAIDRPQAADLPAVRWKLINLEKLKNENGTKHAAQRRELEALLS